MWKDGDGNFPLVLNPLSHAISDTEDPVLFLEEQGVVGDLKV
jgi:hypothetical protein